MRQLSRGLPFAVLLIVLLLPTRAAASPVFIDFESFFEFDPVGTIDVATFSIVGGASPQVLTSGSTLNEFDFPSTSPFNVVADVDDFNANTGGPIRIVFSTPVVSFSGFFTYLAPLTIEAFSDVGGTNLVDDDVSASSNNLGSTEKLDVVNALGIRSILITGSLGGGSFTLDDVEFDTLAVAPEPGTLLLFGAAAGAFVGRHVRRRVQRSHSLQK